MVATRRASIAAILTAGCSLIALSPPAYAETPDHADTRAPQAAVAPLVWVHIDSPSPVDLETQLPGEGWHQVCTSPCDKALPSEHYYRVGGAGVRASAPVTLGPGQRVVMHVDPGSSGGQTIGVTLTVLGIIGLSPGLGVTAAIVGGEIAGVILICPIAIAFVSKAKQNSEYGNCLSDIATYLAKGYASPYVWGPAIAGGVLTTAGVVWLTQVHGTNVNQTPQSAAASGRWWPADGDRASSSGWSARFPEPILFRSIDLTF